jgi:hypothetical protein
MQGIIMSSFLAPHRANYISKGQRLKPPILQILFVTAEAVTHKQTAVSYKQTALTYKQSAVSYEQTVATYKQTAVTRKPTQRRFRFVYVAPAFRRAL